jgi:hydroxysqualene dehydroxylase
MKSGELPRKVDVAIIGGGLSGLAAAVELALSGVDVALFERSPKLGGRCYSYVDVKTGDVVDNGQHVLLGAYHNALRYLKLVGTREFLHEESGLVLPFHHPRKGRGLFESSSLPKPFHLTTGMLKFKLLSFRERQKLLKVGLELNRLNDALEKRLSSLTIEQWLTSLNQSDEAKRSLWYPIAISAMNELPHRASALLFALSLRAAFLGKKSDSGFLIPTIGQTDLYVAGAEKIFHKEKTKVFLNTEIQSLAIAGSRAVGLRLKGNKTVSANYVISAVPYYSLYNLLPQKLCKEKPFVDLHKFESSPIVSIHLWFDKDFMDVPYIGLIDRKVQWVFNRRKIMQKERQPTGYISTVISGAHDVVDLSKDDLVKIALCELNEVFPDSRHARLVHSIVIKEKRATFSPTNEVESLRPSVETSILNFFLAGDWTNTGLPPTIEGAVLSGFHAARLVTE